MSTCPQCDQPGIFGYRDKETGEMTWYCTAHRLGQYWADARRGEGNQCNQPSWEGWRDRGPKRDS
jgi:hypothetical protein